MTTVCRRRFRACSVLYCLAVVVLPAIATLAFAEDLNGADSAQVEWNSLPPELQGFKSWSWSSGPFMVARELAELCSRRVPFAGHPVRPGETFISPNDKFGVNAYANQLAGQRLNQRSHNPFPVGAVIVKEKLAGKGALKPTGHLGVMIKRQAGFYPERGDWEFLLVAADGAVERDREVLKNCYECHFDPSNRRPVDSVFAATFNYQLPDHPRGYQPVVIQIERVEGIAGRIPLNSIAALVSIAQHDARGGEAVVLPNLVVLADSRRGQPGTTDLEAGAVTVLVKNEELDSVRKADEAGELAIRVLAKLSAAQPGSSARPEGSGRVWIGKQSEADELIFRDGKLVPAQ